MCVLESSKVGKREDGGKKKEYRLSFCYKKSTCVVASFVTCVC